MGERHGQEPDQKATVSEDFGEEIARERLSHPPRTVVGFGAAIRREIVRRLVSKQSNVVNLPEFSEYHPDIDFILGVKDRHLAPILMRVFDVAASIIEEERAHLRKDAAELDEREAALRVPIGAPKPDDGLPEDICGTLEAAIQACGARNHTAAKKRVGEKLYEAIKHAAPQANWSWLCRQNVSDLPRLVKKIEQAVGRNRYSGDSYRSKTGGGTHFKSTQRVGRRAVHPDDLPSILAPLAKAQGYYFPIEQLKEYRLTASDWNAMVGLVLKKAEMGFVDKRGFGAYLLKVVQNWEQKHPIKSGGET